MLKKRSLTTETMNNEQIKTGFPWHIVVMAILILFIVALAGYSMFNRGYREGKFNTEATYGFPPPAHGMSHMDIEMNNCQMHIKAQQEHNSLSPLCYCEYDEKTNAYAVRCDTCDPFQQYGPDFECGQTTE